MLTAYIISADDGQLTLGAIEMRALRATSNTVEGIADTVKAPAAVMTGRSPADFDVDVLF